MHRLYVSDENSEATSIGPDRTESVSTICTLVLSILLKLCLVSYCFVFLMILLICLSCFCVEYNLLVSGVIEFHYFDFRISEQ